MSRVSTRHAFAERAGSFLTGAGAGGGATSTVTRDRDLAAYEAMKAGLPKKPPSQLRPREDAGSPKTGDADSLVPSPKSSNYPRARDEE